MATSAVTKLAQVEAAIEALLTGGASSYAIGNRSVTKLDLKTLFEERRMLTIQADRELNGGFRVAKMRRAGS